MNRQQPRGNLPGHRLSLTGLVGCWICSVLVFSAPAAAQGLGQNAQELFASESSQSVFVRDSAVAVEKFALATRMERLREWDKAADVYQELIRSYSDRVVPWRLNEKKKLFQYVSVVPAVEQQLARWPAEGLAVYRARFEGEAAALLEGAHGDAARLHLVWAQYFVTESARQAAIRLMDLYIERGEFSAAAWIGDRLLDLHPALGSERPKILYRTALAYHLAGDDGRVPGRLAELKEKFPQASAQIRGGDVILSESLGQEIAAVQAARGASSPESWPMAFGSPDRSRIIDTTNFGGARLFSIEIPKPTLRTAAIQQRQEMERATSRDMSSGLMTGIFPVVDRGELFFQDNARVYAVSLESGLPLAGWAQTYNGERGGRYSTNSWPLPRSHQSTLSVTDSRVLAIMGQPDLISMNYTGTYGLRDTRLVCLDRRSGEELWVARPRQFPDEAANLRNLDLAGSPLVVGNIVYMQARGGKGMQFEDSYVVALDLSSGAFKWASYIASANSSAQVWDGSDVGALFGQSVSHLAYSSGHIYVLTNLGAVAAIDAYEGTISWLDLYDRDVADAGRMGGGLRVGLRFARQVQGSASVKPWTSNPVIVSQGRVFILPADGLYLHIYDARSGEELKRIALSKFDNADTMLAVMDEKLIINSDDQVFCIDWPNYDATKDRNGNLVWATSELQRSGKPDGSIRGRGFVTADSVLIPTAWQLYRISLGGGVIIEVYPPGKSTAWGDDEGPGNVIVTRDRMIIAGPTDSGEMRINAYTDLGLAMARLDAAVAAAPEDASLRLRYAEIMFVASKYDAAVGKLDEAIAMLSRGGNMADANRDRIFATALTFAQKLAREGRPELAEIVLGLFDRAGLAATTPSQQVNYRLSRAAHARQMNHPDQEIRFYQQILSDKELRGVSVTDDNGAARAASEIARESIDSVIQRAGPEAYAQYEKAAGEMLDAASRVSNPGILQSIAELYPNSNAAIRALLAAADVYEANSDPRAATQVLRQAYFRYSKGADTAKILEAMARNYLRIPNHVEVAIARLNQASDPRSGASPQLTRPLVLPDGRRIENTTLAGAAESLKQERAAEQLSSVPMMGLPTVRKAATFAPATPDSIIPGVARLITAEKGFVSNDRVVTFTPNTGVRVFGVGQSKPSFTSAALRNTAIGCGWIERNLLIWNETEMAYLDQNGQTLWNKEFKSLPQLQVAQRTEVVTPPAPAAGADNPPRQQPGVVIVGGGMNAGGAVIIRNNQRILLGPNGVQIVNAPAAGPEAANKPAEEQIVHARILLDRLVIGTTEGRIMALSLDGGNLLWQSRLGDRAATHLLATDDFVVARYADNSVAAQLTIYDADSGQVISQRSFGGDTGGFPVNLALSPDGMLVYLMPDRIVGKDLFEPGGLDSKATFERGGGGPAMFQASVDPQHLQVIGDRMIVVSNDNGGGSVVRVHSLRTGAIVPFNLSDALIRMDAVTNTSPFMIRALGSRVYVASRQEMRGFGIDNGTSWVGPINGRTGINVRDLVITQGHVVALTEPAGLPVRRAANLPMPFLRINAYSRALTDDQGNESALLDNYVELSEPSGILNWQVVNGGFYYVDGQQRLHFLQGAAAK